jgi:Fe2+ or Zn2+ uptake regulation protein
MDSQNAVLDLLWSLWGELGVSSVIRNHERVVIDPEPLLVVTPWLARADPRLAGEALRWCTQNADRISTTRLQGLIKRSPPHVRQAFSEMAAALKPLGIRWPTDGLKPWPLPSQPKKRPVTPQRPSMLRFRLRAMCGVSTRADVIAELMSSPEIRAYSATELDYLGYSKVSIYQSLVELADAGLVRQFQVKNTQRFRLVESQRWLDLVHGSDLRWMDWNVVFHVALLADELEDLSEVPLSIRDIEAAGVIASLTAWTDMLGLPQPAAGLGDRWARARAWCATFLATAASGPEDSVPPDPSRPLLLHER